MSKEQRMYSYSWIQSKCSTHTHECRASVYSYSTHCILVKGWLSRPRATCASSATPPLVLSSLPVFPPDHGLGWAWVGPNYIASIASTNPCYCSYLLISYCVVNSSLLLRNLTSQFNRFVFLAGRCRAHARWLGSIEFCFFLRVIARLV